MNIWTSVSQQFSIDWEFEAIFHHVPDKNIFSKVNICMQGDVRKNVSNQPRWQDCKTNHCLETNVVTLSATRSRPNPADHRSNYLTVFHQLSQHCAPKWISQSCISKLVVFMSTCKHRSVTILNQHRLTGQGKSALVGEGLPGDLLPFLICYQLFVDFKTISKFLF